MRTLTFSEARGNLKEVLDRVEDDADFTIITRRDAGAAVVMSLDTFNSWRETLYLLSSPANARHLAKSLAELDAGQGKPYPLIEPSKPVRVHEKRTPYAPKPHKPGAKRATKKHV